MRGRCGCSRAARTRRKKTAPTPAPSLTPPPPPPPRHAQGSLDRGEDETLNQFATDGAWDADVVTALDQATRVEHTLDGKSADWARDLGAYDGDNDHWQCWESDCPASDGYPSICYQRTKKVTIARLLAMPYDGVVPKRPSVSHLCHNKRCINPAHLVYEPMDVNLGRGGCVGGYFCRHVTACLRPGRYCRGFLAEPGYDD